MDKCSDKHALSGTWTMILEVPECAAMNSSSGCSTKSDIRCRFAAGSSGSGGGACPGSVGAPGAADVQGGNHCSLKARAIMWLILGGLAAAAACVFRGIYHVALPVQHHR